MTEMCCLVGGRFTLCWLTSNNVCALDARVLFRTMSNVGMSSFSATIRFRSIMSFKGVVFVSWRQQTLPSHAWGDLVTALYENLFVYYCKKMVKALIRSESESSFSNLCLFVSFKCLYTGEVIFVC